MASRITLTIACDDFDHIRALMDGAVKPPGIDLVFITELTNPERHGRMVRDLAFDVCELNLPTYLIARDTGVPITAIPIFLFRRFRHGHVFINPQSGINKPEDLIGQRIGCTTMQPASNVWINGILQDRHGVPYREQTWVVERDEDAPFTPPAWLKVERMPRGKSAVSMLLNGELPALMSPQTPKPILDGDKRIARLFPDYVERERAYFQETGIFPDHARHHDQTGDCRLLSVGAHDAVPRVRGGKAARLSAHGERACRAAAVVRRALGGGAQAVRSRSVGLWPRRGEPQDHRDRGPLHPRAGHDVAAHVDRRDVRAGLYVTLVFRGRNQLE